MRATMRLLLALPVAALGGCGLLLNPDFAPQSDGTDAGPRDGSIDSGSRDAATDGPVGDAVLDARPVDGTTDAVGVDSSTPGPGCVDGFGTPALLTELNSSSNDLSPSLTGDMLEIYFVSDRDGGMGDVFFARRATVSDPFGTPIRVEELSTTYVESGAHVSLDGRTLYLASDRGGSLDIWRSTRPDRTSAWSVPDSVTELNSVTADSGPSLVAATGDLVFARALEPRANLFLATWSPASDAFGPINGLSSINTTRSDRNPFMSDALTIYFTSDRIEAGGGADIFCAERSTRSEPFATPTVVTSLAGPTDDDDPWLSPDGRTMYLTRETASGDDLYVASR